MEANGSAFLVVDPESGKKHDRFFEVENIEIDLLDRHTQLSGKTTVKKTSIGKAVKDGVVDNETLGYFLARIYLFLKKIGVDTRKVRFRQHMVSLSSTTLLQIPHLAINNPYLFVLTLTKFNRPMRWWVTLQPLSLNSTDDY